jgi:hypothetical protein
MRGMRALSNGSLVLRNPNGPYVKMKSFPKMRPWSAAMCSESCQDGSKPTPTPPKKTVGKRRK